MNALFVALILVSIAGCTPHSDRPPKKRALTPSAIDHHIDAATIEDHILALPAFAFHEESTGDFRKRIRGARSLPQNKGRSLDSLYCPGDGTWPAKEFIWDRQKRTLTINVQSDGIDPGYTVIMQRGPGEWIRSTPTGLQHVRPN